MSRLTFRRKVDVCWQKQLRDQHLSLGTPDVPHLDVGRSVVRRVSYRLAKQIILQYEWLGTMAATGHHFGIFFGDFCAGVTCIAAGGGTGSVNGHKLFRIRRNEFGTLARGACVHWSPVGTNSRLVAWTCRLLRRSTSLKLLIAYADTDAGEIGTIYQACNWVYIGKGSATRQWVSPEGRVHDQKLPYNLKLQKGGTRAGWCKALRAKGWREQESNPKYRYVYVIDKRDKSLLRLVETMRRPYPKRQLAGVVLDGSTLADQASSGGSIPTRPLRR